MEIVELHSAAEHREALPTLRELYPWLDEGRYAALLAEMVDDGYRQFALRNEAQEVVAVAGVAIHVNIYYGRYLYVYDLVVREVRGPRDMGHCLWTTWKRSAAAKGARQPHWLSVWIERGRSASTSVGATRRPVTRCARRWAKRGAVWASSGHHNPYSPECGEVQFS
jgi:hypothetical protein